MAIVTQQDLSFSFSRPQQPCWPQRIPDRADECDLPISQTVPLARPMRSPSLGSSKPVLSLYSLLMARQKQISPMQRQPSGEIMDSHTSGSTTSRQTANARKPIFKWSDGAIAKSKTTSFGSTGGSKTQLVICVAGIYASLYALPSSIKPRSNAHSMTAVSPGLSCKSASPRPHTKAIPPFTLSPIRLSNTFAFPSSLIPFNPSWPRS